MGYLEQSGSGGGGVSEARVRQLALEVANNAIPDSQFKTLADLAAATKVEGETYTVWDDPTPDNNGIYDYAQDASGPGTGPGLVKVGIPLSQGGQGGVTEARALELIEDAKGAYKDYASPADIPDNHIGRSNGKLYSKDQDSDQPDLIRDQS